MAAEIPGNGDIGPIEPPNGPKGPQGGPLGEPTPSGVPPLPDDSGEEESLFFMPEEWTRPDARTSPAAGGRPDFRRPFDGTSISESEVALAGGAFRHMTTSIYNSHPQTEDSLDGDRLGRYIELTSEDRSLQFQLFQEVDIESGEVLGEKVGVYEAGVSEDVWGAKICDYVTGQRGPAVIRFDSMIQEKRVLEDDILLADADAYDEITMAIDGINLEVRMGLNGGHVGIEEVADLRALVSRAKPIPPIVPNQ